MLAVQNVFLNVINKYTYLDLIGVQSFELLITLKTKNRNLAFIMCLDGTYH